MTADVLDDAHVLILHTVSPSSSLASFPPRQPAHVFRCPPAGPRLPLELLQQSLLLAAHGETGAEGPGAALLPGPAAGLPHPPGEFKFKNLLWEPFVTQAILSRVDLIYCIFKL